VALHDLLLGSTLLCLSLATQGQPGTGLQLLSRSLDGYTVQWSTAATGFLPEDVVATHNLEPSGRGMLHVVVLAKPQDEGVPVPVRALVSATVTNLLGETRDIDMREIIEHGRASYLGTFEIEDRRMLRFALRIQPPGGVAAETFHFQRRFLTE
jgi:hypothetical protein